MIKDAWSNKTFRIGFGVSVTCLMLAIFLLIITRLSLSEDTSSVLSSIELGSSCAEVSEAIKPRDIDCDNITIKPLSWHDLSGRVEILPTSFIGSYSDSVDFDIDGEEYTIRFDFVRDRLVLITYNYNGDKPQHLLHHFSEIYGEDARDVVHKRGLVGTSYFGVVEWQPGVYMYYDGFGNSQAYRLDHEWYASHTSDFR